MSYKALDFAMQASVDTSTERLVLVCLAWHMNDQTGRCDPSVDGIKARTLVGIHQVRSALASLEAKGLIRRIESKGKRTQYDILISDPVLISTPSRSVPRTDKYPVPIGTPSRSVPPPRTDEYPHPVPISTPNKEVTEKEQGSNEPNLSDPVFKKIKSTYKPKARTHRFELTEIPDAWRDYCKDVRPDLNPNIMFKNFAFYYTRGKGADQLRGDKGWSQCWQTWVRGESEHRRRPQQQEPTHHRLDGMELARKHQQDIRDWEATQRISRAADPTEQMLKEVETLMELEMM